MGKLRSLISRRIESVIIIGILVGSLLGVFFVQEKMVLLNFYYVPVLVAGYFLGKKHAVLAAVFCVLATVFFVILYPDMFVRRGRSTVEIVTLLLAWGGFLVLTAGIASYLYEMNQERIRELREAYVGVLEILTKYLESTDGYTKGHSVRVAEMAMNTAKAMNLEATDVETIRVAALLHDIGKVDISTDVLNKAADLTEAEREYVQSHLQKGESILKSVGTVLKDAVPLVLAHHKYFANGRASENMPLGARIIAVSDAFDAMTTDRPYRKAMPPWDAMQELKRCAGTQFDPAVVKVFEPIAADSVEVA